MATDNYVMHVLIINNELSDVYHILTIICKLLMEKSIVELILYFFFQKLAMELYVIEFKKLIFYCSAVDNSFIAKYRKIIFWLQQQ